MNNYMMKESGPSLESEPRYGFGVVEIPVDDETVFAVQTENGDVNQAIIDLLPGDITARAWSSDSGEAIEGARQNAAKLKENLMLPEVQELIENYIFDKRQLRRKQDSEYSKCLASQDDWLWEKFNDMRARQNGEVTDLKRKYREQLSQMTGIHIKTEAELAPGGLPYRFNVIEVPAAGERIFVVQSTDGDLNQEIVGSIVPEDVAARYWNDFDKSKGSLEDARINAYKLKKKFMTPRVQELIGEYLQKKEENRLRQSGEIREVGADSKALSDNQLKEDNDFAREYGKKMDKLLGI
jgi:hypothetical protein